MPWHVSKTAQCPASKPWGVILDATGKVVKGGCHGTKAEAVAHMDALYANEPGAKMSDLTGCLPCDAKRAETPLHYRDGVDHSAWDKTKAMSACANSDAPASCYASICAGKKAGDKSTQEAWALPHHYPGKGPNEAGTRNALARLSSTQGLTNEAQARSHLEAHMKQINPDYEPSSNSAVAVLDRAGVAMGRANALAGNNRAVPNGSARAQLFRGAILRAKPVKLEGRSGDFYEVEGYASVVDTPYEMYDMFGPYDEEIRLGAFDKSLANPELDTAFLTNHRGVTMARTTNGTLALWADSTGLGARAWLNANRQDVRDLISAIDDGLIDEMSFAFYLNAGGWNESYDKFTILEADIHRGDVSAVNYGANPYTSIAARATEIIAELSHLPAGAARAALVALRSRPDIGEPAIVPSVPVELGRVDIGDALPQWEADLLAENAAHGKPNGAHTHKHQAYGSQGADEMHTHAHSHSGDDNHDHKHAYSADDGDTVTAPPKGPSTEMLAEEMRIADEYERDAED